MQVMSSVLFLRALIAFLILPGTFAGLLPGWIVSADRWRGEGSLMGLVPLCLGAAILLWSVRDFYVAGKGTLAPWDPPRHLVIVGLYRFVRNPMYVGILVLLIGWSFWAGSWMLACYTALMAVAFHLRVVLYEEPRLQSQFPEEWQAYSGRVPRWVPNLLKIVRGKSKERA
jgi:protein-S-isoprenylcysteine O-methyltransferase Ste14